jgi:hypothetical protein
MVAGRATTRDELTMLPACEGARCDNWHETMGMPSEGVIMSRKHLESSAACIVST